MNHDPLIKKKEAIFAMFPEACDIYANKNKKYTHY
jgi:hypothetical protein